MNVIVTAISLYMCIRTERKIRPSLKLLEISISSLDNLTAMYYVIHLRTLEFKIKCEVVFYTYGYHQNIIGNISQLTCLRLDLF